MTRLFLTNFNKSPTGMKIFKKVSGMKINFNKNEFVPMNLSDEEIHAVTHVLDCPAGSLHFKYLGVPIHFEKLKREDIQSVINKLIKRVIGWRGRLLAYSSRLTLIKLCLASIPMYLFSFLKFPKWTIKLFESQMTHCL
jgi:hypothetical protein